MDKKVRPQSRKSHIVNGILLQLNINLVLGKPLKRKSSEHVLHFLMIRNFAKFLSYKREGRIKYINFYKTKFLVYSLVVIISNIFDHF